MRIQTQDRAKVALKSKSIKRRYAIAIIVEDDGNADTGQKIFIPKKDLLNELRNFPQAAGVEVTRISVLNVEEW